MKASQVNQLQLLLRSFCRKAEAITKRKVTVIFDGEDIKDVKFSNLLPDEIMQIVSDKFNVNIGDIKSKSRKREYVYARHAAAFYLYWYANQTLTGTGRKLGGRDHATVLNSHEAYRNLIETDPFYETMHEEILHEINLYRNASKSE